MRVAIHQPNFLPWLGFFYKICQSESFVFLDHVQFSKGELTNRVAIKHWQDKLWLTIPVLTKGKGKQPICDVKINHLQNWKRKHLRTIAQCYQKTPFFQEIFSMMEEIYDCEWQYLAEFNINFIKKITQKIKIHTPLIKSSALGVSGIKSELLVQIIKIVGGNEYLSGAGASAYNDSKFFEDNEIKLTYIKYVPPAYKQISPEPFIEGLSIIDYLFNCGTDIDIIKPSKTPDSCLEM